MSLKPMAWVIPSHPPRFPLLERFIGSFNSSRIEGDVWCVVSSDEDHEALSNLNLDVQILNAAPLVKGLGNNGGVINQKKLVALWELRNKYEKVIITDDETEITKPPPANFTRDLVTWGFTEAHPGVMAISSATSQLKLPAQIFGEKLEEFAQLYGWFSNPPIYESSEIEDFFEFLGFRSTQDLAQVSWEMFDYVLWQAFFYCTRPELFAYRSHVYRNVTSPAGMSSWETGPTSISRARFLRRDAAYRPVYWAVENRPWDANCFIRFHTDRDWSVGIPAVATMKSIGSKFVRPQKQLDQGDCGYRR